MGGHSSNPRCSKVHLYIEVYNKHINIGNLNKLPVITVMTVLMMVLMIIIMTLLNKCLLWPDALLSAIQILYYSN